MAVSILGLALYLMALASWAKQLRAKNTPLPKRRVAGIAAAFLPLLWYAYLIYEAHGNVVVWLAITLLVWSVCVAILGYITVVHAPKWIVGNRV